MIDERAGNRKLQLGGANVDTKKLNETLTNLMERYCWHETLVFGLWKDEAKAILRNDYSAEDEAQCLAVEQEMRDIQIALESVRYQLVEAERQEIEASRDEDFRKALEIADGRVQRALWIQQGLTEAARLLAADRKDHGRMWSLLLRHFWDQWDDALVGECQNPVVAVVQQLALKKLGIACTEPGGRSIHSVTCAAEEARKKLAEMIDRHHHHHEVSVAASPVTPDRSA